MTGFEPALALHRRMVAARARRLTSAAPCFGRFRLHQNAPPEPFGKAYPWSRWFGPQETAGRELCKKNKATVVALTLVVGVTGFEPAASWSRTKRSTKLSHTPIATLYNATGNANTAAFIPNISIIAQGFRFVNLYRKKSSRFFAVKVQVPLATAFLSNHTYFSLCMNIKNGRTLLTVKENLHCSTMILEKIKAGKTKEQKK